MNPEEIYNTETTCYNPTLYLDKQCKGCICIQFCKIYETEVKNKKGKKSKEMD